MKEYQQRVFLEKKVLEVKAKRLSEFIELNPEFNKLDEEDKKLLRNQNDVMWQYFKILKKRINRFN